LLSLTDQVGLTDALQPMPSIPPGIHKV
jgi:hypothetical protein